MRVCLITTGQPSSNPRLVKEADALAAAGLDVRVIGAYWADWATAEDKRLLAYKPWSFTFVDWRRETRPEVYWRTGLRHHLASAFVGWPLIDWWAVPAAIGRVTPELTQAAIDAPADLYIAHNLGALPAAAVAARAHGARLGFDAEDFHRGQFADGEAPRRRRLTERVEEALLPECDVVTAASGRIARAYAPFCAVEPVPVLNVFPRDMRPDSRRATASAGPVTLYWFSQTIGADRGLEDVVRVLGRFPEGALELHLRGNLQPGFGAALERMARESGAAPARIVMHPPAPPADMVTLAAGYDIGLAVEPGTPLNNDLTASNKLFTYLLAGNAILATRTAGQRDVLDEIGTAAATFVAGDLDGMTASLSAWLDDRARLEAARVESWAWGGARYNWDVERDRWLDAIFRILRAGAVPLRPSRAAVGLGARRQMSPQP